MKFILIIITTLLLTPLAELKAADITFSMQQVQTYDIRSASAPCV